MPGVCNEHGKHIGRQTGGTYTIIGKQMKRMISMDGMPGTALAVVDEETAGTGSVAGAIRAPRTTLKFEKERFANDYPRLKVYFEPSDNTHFAWKCVITTMTMMHGEYGILEGEGRTKRLALLAARRKPDEERAETKRREHEEELRRAAAGERERELDEALFSSI